MKVIKPQSLKDSFFISGPEVAKPLGMASPADLATEGLFFA